MHPTRDLLVAAPERLDEACFAVPALRAILASALHAGIVCPDDQAPLWHSIPGLTVISFPQAAKPKTIASLAGPDWKAALIWEPGRIADAIPSTGIQKRIGPNHPKLKKILTHPLSPILPHTEHRVRFYLSIPEELGIPTAKPEFFTPTSEPSPDLPVLLCPDSDFGHSHEWKPDGWYEIGKSLVLQGRSVTVAGLNGGRGLGERLAANLGRGAEYRMMDGSARDLEALAGYRLVVAADGTLPHLAAHAGATCVTLFGPNDPNWKRPLGKRHAVVRRHVECAPCLLGKCPLDLRCQKELPLERVMAAVSEKLG